LAFLQGIKPAARRRGIVWHVGTTLRGYRDEGQPFVTDSPAASWRNLGGESRTLAVAVARTKVPAESPYLAVLSLEREPTTLTLAPEHAWRYGKHRDAFGLFGKWPLEKHTGWKKIDALHGAHDIVATPGANEGEALVYAATGASIRRYVLGGESAGPGGELRLDPTFLMDGVFTPRPGFTLSTLANVDAVVYGGCASACLKAWFAGAAGGPAVQGAFAAPRDAMFGMTANATFVWVFTFRRTGGSRRTQATRTASTSNRCSAGRWSTAWPRRSPGQSRPAADRRNHACARDQR
jgi:hypothetical protein